MAISPETLTWEKNDMNGNKYYIDYKKGRRTIRFVTNDYGELCEEYDLLDHDPDVEIIKVENGSPDEEPLPDHPFLAYYSMTHWIY
jgi:hypothetical protein